MTFVSAKVTKTTPPGARDFLLRSSPHRALDQLAGFLELPAQAPRAYALFAHCFTCSKDIGAATRITRALAARGFGVLRFDFTGLGNSEGDFAQAISVTAERFAAIMSASP